MDSTPTNSFDGEVWNPAKVWNGRWKTGLNSPGATNGKEERKEGESRAHWIRRKGNAWQVHELPGGRIFGGLMLQPLHLQTKGTDTDCIQDYSNLTTQPI